MKKAMSLVEVIVGSIILAITFSGLLATFVGVRKYIKRANKRLIATDLVSQTLSDLYREVDWETWQDGTSELSIGNVPVDSYTIDNHIYGSSPNSYSVTSPTGAPDGYRRVSVTVNYP